MLTEQQIVKSTEEVFRNYYVPFYPVDKPISEMTAYEQGLYKQVSLIAMTVIKAIKERFDLVKKK